MASCGAIYPFLRCLGYKSTFQKRSAYIKHYVANFHGHVEFQRQFVVLAKTSNHTCDGTTPAQFRTDMLQAENAVLQLPETENFRSSPCTARSSKYCGKNAANKQLLHQIRSSCLTPSNAHSTASGLQRVGANRFDSQSLTNNCIHWRAWRWRQTKSCWPRRDSDASSTSVKRPIAGAKDDKVPAPHPGHAVSRPIPCARSGRGVSVCVRDLFLSHRCSTRPNCLP